MALGTSNSGKERRPEGRENSPVKVPPQNNELFTPR